MNINKIKYSIIVPTLNEENIIDKFLNSLFDNIANYKNDCEIIIVDGGSIDRTVEICQKYNVNLINSVEGRGIQQKKGAESALGETLIFLHCDLEIPFNLLNYIETNFVSKVKVATFRTYFNNNKILFRVYSYCTKFDSIFTTFGDQGIIINKKFYNMIGGFKEIPLMEDVDLFIRCRKLANIKKFNINIIASTRKFDEAGVVKIQIKSFFLIIMFLLGFNSDNLYKKYYYNDHKKVKSSSNFRKAS